MARSDTLDSTIDIVTPENIVFHYRLAGPFQRLPAFLIDVGIRLAVFIAAAIVFGLLFGFSGLGEIGAGLTFVLLFAMEWFYGGYFETVWNGQTPGKRLLGLRVLTTDGLPINAGQAVMRNILRAADALPLVSLFFGFYIVGLVSSVMNKRYQRLGDLACSTMVVVEERRRIRDVTRVFIAGLSDMTAQLPATFRPSRSLTKALANYVARRPILSPERRKEIADVLGPILVDKFGLPPGTDSDLLLCAVYCKAFGIEPGQDPTSPGGSPFSGSSPFSTGGAAAPRPITPGGPAIAAAVVEAELKSTDQRSTNG